MKLRRNQYCPIHRSLCCCGCEPHQKSIRIRRLGVQRVKISTIREDTVSSASGQKCESRSIANC